MNNVLSDANRLICVEAIKANLALCQSTIPAECKATINEMIAAGTKPYHVSNLKYVGDTVDRHSWHPYGNALEVAAVAHLSTMGLLDIELARSYNLQVTKKVDLILNGRDTIQVKRLRVGSHGDVFVSHHDVAGTADIVAYVGSSPKAIFRLSKQPFLEYCASQEWKGIDKYPNAGIGRTTDNVGWFIKPQWGESVGFLFADKISDKISVVEYNSTTKLVSIK